MKITVVGAGYVGLSNAILLAQDNEVVALDLNKDIVDLLNKGKAHIRDPEIAHFLAKGKLNFSATTNANEAYKDTDMVIISTPTNYDEESNSFDTSSVDSVINEVIALNRDLPIFIKSTIPVGYTKAMRQATAYDKIIFSPEFLREGKALYDNLHPSRIIVGDYTAEARKFAGLLQEGAKDEDVPVLFMDSTEAEATKLFANTYLAMRVAFFNELDTYAEVRELNAMSIIQGVGLDPRIGTHYNNPSFGYGGYCLPKDTKQLLANFEGVPNKLVKAIVESNATRKNFIAQSIKRKNPKVVGVYRLTMKQGSDNYRESAIHTVIQELLQENDLEVIIYEPTWKDKEYQGLQVYDNLSLFKEKVDLIITNRFSAELNDVKDKVYTRDLFNEN